MSGSYSQYKDKVKTLDGVTNDVQWKIDVYLTSEGGYVAEARAGSMTMTTHPAENADDAVAMGCQCLLEMFDGLGV